MFHDMQDRESVTMLLQGLAAWKWCLEIPLTLRKWTSHLAGQETYILHFKSLSTSLIGLEMRGNIQINDATTSRWIYELGSVWHCEVPFWSKVEPALVVRSWFLQGWGHANRCSRWPCPLALAEAALLGQFKTRERPFGTHRLHHRRQWKMSRMCLLGSKQVWCQLDVGHTIPKRGLSEKNKLPFISPLAINSFFLTRITRINVEPLRMEKSSPSCCASHF